MVRGSFTIGAALALGVGALSITSACDNSERTSSIAAAVPNASGMAPVTDAALSAPTVIPTMGAHRLAIQTSPGAACVVHAQGVPVTAQNGRFYADAAGLLRFYLDSVSEQATDPSSFAAVDCTASDGAVLPTQLLDPTAASSYERSASAAIEASATIRPALQGDPNAPSQSALTANGYLHRPDPSNQAAYQNWLKLVSTPLEKLAPSTVVHQGRTNNLNLSDSEIWAGPVLANSGTQYLQTETWFAVPPVVGEPNMPLYAQLSFWTGLDGQVGLGADSVCQAGTQSTINNGGLGLFSWQYFAWIEWAGTGNEFEAGLSIATNPNDEMAIGVWVGDANQQVDAAGGYCWAAVVNMTTNQLQIASYGKPSESTFYGTSAEWIAERPTDCSWFFGWDCSPAPLAHFGTIQQQNAYAFDAANVSHDTSTDSTNLNWMYETYNWTGLLAASEMAGPANSVYYWYMYQ